MLTILCRFFRRSDLRNAASGAVAVLVRKVMRILIKVIDPGGVELLAGA